MIGPFIIATNNLIQIVHVEYVNRGILDNKFTQVRATKDLIYINWEEIWGIYVNI